MVWQMDKNITVAHILTAIVIIGSLFASLFAWVSAIDRRSDHNEQEIIHIVNAVKAESKRLDTLRSDIQHDLDRINNKLDRLIERQK